jgi:serum/glucocorticoid-regulated kinase 2
MKGPSVEDYSLLSVIGRGTYAKVLLVRSKQDKQVYAMKVLKKKYIQEKNQEKNIMNEKEILSSLSHPFLVRLRECFQDHKKLYFVLEYCPGGELFGLLSLKDRLSEEQYVTPHADASSTPRRSSWPWTPCTN